MRTSTGSMSVTKIIQKTTLRRGKRKYTMANADSMEMVILPMAITSALIRLTSIMGAAAGYLLPMLLSPPNSASRYVSMK